MVVAASMGSGWNGYDEWAVTNDVAAGSDAAVGGIEA
jgi:hypothetical protein